MPISTERLGTATPGSPIRSFLAADGRCYFVTRVVTPTRLGVLDLDDRRVVDHVVLEDTSGAWDLATVGDDVYVGSSSPAGLFRFDPATGDATRLAVFGDDRVVCALDAVDGRLYAGTYPSASLYEYDVSDGTVRDFGELHPDERYARSVCATPDHVYVGTAQGAQVYRIDRETGEAIDLAPGELDGETSAREADCSDRYVVVRTQPSLNLLVLDRADPACYRITHPPAAENVGQFFVEDGAVYLVATSGGGDADGDEDGDGVDDEEGNDGEGGDDGIRWLYRYDLGDDAYERLGVLPGNTFDLHRSGDLVVGGESDGTVWTYDRRDGATTTTDVVEAGVPTGGGVPFSIAAPEGTPVVAGHRRLYVHAGGEEPERIPAPGEAKATTAVDDRLYHAFYTDAIVASYDLGDGELTELARIGDRQNRPRDVCYHDPTDMLFVGTKPDYGNLGGALSAYDVETGALTIERNVIPDQSIRSLAAADDRVYLGSEIYGEKVDPVAEEAHVAAWDPAAGALDWEFVPVADAAAVAELAVFDDHLYGVTESGTLFVVDPAERAVVRRDESAFEDGSFDLPGNQLLAHRGQLYCIAEGRLLRRTPGADEWTTLADELDARNPMIAAHDGALYTVAGTDLLQIDPN